MSEELLFLEPDEHWETVVCRICGIPSKVGISDHALPAHVAKLVGLYACKQCNRDHARGAVEMERPGRDENRSKVWEGLCPIEFRKPVDFNHKHADRELFSRIMNWEPGQRGIICYGPTGHCKTRFIWKLLKRLFDDGQSIAAFTHPEFRMTASRRAKDVDELASWVKWQACRDLWFLDDLGKGNITPASEEALEETVDARTRMNKPMFITTNSGQDDLLARFSPDRGGPIVRRILDHCEPIQF